MSGIERHASLLSDFAFETGLEQWNVSMHEWLVRHNKTDELDGLGTNVAVFNPASQLLILQRAAHDSLPGRWELPGGAVDAEDSTVLHGAARELFEEAGLTAVRFTKALTAGPSTEPGNVFLNSSKTRTFCQFSFMAETQHSIVKLDPNEHQSFLWATEQDIREQKTVNGELTITSDTVRAVMLEAFRLSHLTSTRRQLQAVRSASVRSGLTLK